MYRKFFYACSLLVIAATGLVSGQTKKGTQYLGLEMSAGNVTRTTTDFPDRKEREFNISLTPAYSYFVADGWELRGGLGLGLGSSRSKGAEMDRKNTLYALVPQIGFRKHLMLSEKLGFATGPYVVYAFNKLSSEGAETSKYKRWETGVDLQVEYFPVKQFGISARLFGVSYGDLKYELSDRLVLNHQSFSAGLTEQLSLRFFYVFGKGLKN